MFAASSAEDPDVIAADTFPAPGDCADEYDPRRPNEYGTILRARADAAAAQARTAELAAQAQQMMRERQAALSSLGFATAPQTASSTAGAGAPSAAAGTEETAPSLAPLSALSLGLGRGRGGLDMRPAWMTAAAATATASSQSAANTTAATSLPGSKSASEQPSSSASAPASASAAQTHALASIAASATHAAFSSASTATPDGRQAQAPFGSFAWSQGASLPASSASAGSTSNSSSVSGSGPSASSGPASGSNISDKARRMMERWGYTEGRGLGKHETGITAPLVHVKTGRITGVIRGGGRKGPVAHTSGVDSMPDGLAAGSGGSTSNTFVPGAHLQSAVPHSSHAAAGAAASASAAAGTSAAPPVSRVLLLRNMVGPGEVDDELEGEVRDECAAKYGPVVQVLIFECITGAGGAPLPADEAVRIFVEFVDVHSAARALAGLEGRFFGERRLAAGYYDESRFARLELA